MEESISLDYPSKNIPLIRAEEIFAQWRTVGFARIRSQMPLLFRKIEGGFVRLLKDRDECRRWVVTSPFEADPFDAKKEIDLGLLDRRNGQAGHDNKELLHYAPRLIGYLTQQGAQIERYREFLSALNDLYAQCTLLSLEIAERTGTFDRMRNASFLHKLRVARYAGDGAFHTDRAAWTISIMASPHPEQQLWLRNRHGSLVPACEWSPAEILVFPGDKFAMATNWSISPVVHGVAEKHGVYRKVIDGNHRQRVSVQFFCHLEVTQEEWSAGRKRLENLT